MDIKASQLGTARHTLHRHSRATFSNATPVSPISARRAVLDLEEDGTVAKASEEATRAMARVETNFMMAIEYVNINTKLVNEIRD